jgi:hypothetical protein
LETRPPYKVDPAQVEPEVKKLLDGRYEAARQLLRSHGLDDAALSAMSREQVVGRYLIGQYADASNALWKAFGLPFPQASREMLRVWNQLAPQQPPASDNPLIQSDLVSTPPEYRYPAVLRIRYNLERVDRYIALLRVIEALRDYAAAHQGNPPQRLQDIQGLPVPDDTMTGRPFEYQVNGNVVTLDATPPQPFGVFGGWRYELTFQK